MHFQLALLPLCRADASTTRGYAGTAGSHWLSLQADPVPTRGRHRLTAVADEWCVTA
jgi:hypothetical protein